MVYSIVTAPDYVWSRGKVGCLQSHHGDFSLSWLVDFRISQPPARCSPATPLAPWGAGAVLAPTLPGAGFCPAPAPAMHNHVSGITASKINFGTPWAAKKNNFNAIGIIFSYTLLQCGPLLSQNHLSHSTLYGSSSNETSSS